MGVGVFTQNNFRFHYWMKTVVVFQLGQQQKYVCELCECIVECDSRSGGSYGWEGGGEAPENGCVCLVGGDGV